MVSAASKLREVGADWSRVSRRAVALRKELHAESVCDLRAAERSRKENHGDVHE